MKYIIILFIALLYLPLWGKSNRKAKIEQFMAGIYSVTEFRWVADSLQMSISELSHYPIIFLIKKPQRISSGFGMLYHPVYKVWKFHTGIDLPKVKDSPVYATGNGIVTGKGYCPGYGYFIEINHGGSFRSFYAHLIKTMVSIGSSVEIAR